MLEEWDRSMISSCVFCRQKCPKFPHFGLFFYFGAKSSNNLIFGRFFGFLDRAETCILNDKFSTRTSVNTMILSIFDNYMNQCEWIKF